MKAYEILEHPAELRIRVFGETIEDLFKNAVDAVADILVKSKKENEKWEREKKEKIEIKSIDINSLLVDFLSEILAKSQINKCIYYVSSLKLQDLSLEAEVIGYPVERFDEDIKAVTYEDLNIEQKNGTWTTCLVFDI